MKIRAALSRSQDAPFSIEPVQLAEIEPQEMLVELVGTGICHTDLSVVHQHFPLPLPYVLGHEGVGIVKQVGPGVNTYVPGDAVVLSFESCGNCATCGTGHPAYCENSGALNYGRARPDNTPYIIDAQGTGIAGRFLGQSSFATHVIATERNAIKVSAEQSLPHLCGMGCGFMTGAAAVFKLEGLRTTDTVVILGAGALGFAALFAALIRGCSNVLMVDRVATRLALARELGAREIIDTSSGNFDSSLSAVGGIDVCIDTTGVGPLVSAAARALNRRGTLLLLGGGPARIAEIDIMSFIPGKQIRGEIFGDANPHQVIPELIGYFRRGLFPVDRLIRTYPFERINEAAADAASGKTIKPVLVFHQPRS
jgi:aryl-alcohol dehydrogenase